MRHVYYTTPNIALSNNDYAEIKNIFDSGWVCIGKHVSSLEEVFKVRFNVKHAIACASATTGLVIAVKAAGWKNKKILLPSFTWPSTLFAIECNSNTPVYGDINKGTWLLEKSDSEYDAVIPVDVFGNNAKFDTDVPVIYDAAHAFDLTGLGHRGLAEVISLSFTKIVTAVQGGIILTQDDKLAERARELAKLAGKLEEVNAFIALKSIENYDKYNNTIRQKIVKRYKSELCKVIYQETGETNNSVFAVLFDYSQLRDEVRSNLLEAGFETKVYYEPLVRGLSKTDDVFSRILALPVYKGIEQFQDKIIEIVNSTTCRL